MSNSRDVEQWAFWLRAGGKPSTTAGLRVRHMVQVLREIGVSPAEVTSDQLVEFLGSRSWMPNTRKSYRASMRSFFGWLQATGRRSDNPADLVPPVRVPRGLPRPTPEDVYRAALVDADARVRLMMQLAAICGLRRGEIAGLRREDVFQDGLGWSLRVVGKGGHVRPVPMPRGLAAEVRSMPPGFLFPSIMRPGPLTPAHVGVLVSRALPRGWTCHTLRHRCGTMAYASTRDLRAVQELLGHAKPETTMLYTQIPAASIRQAMGAAAEDQWTPPPPTSAA